MAGGAARHANRPDRNLISAASGPGALPGGLDRCVAQGEGRRRRCLAARSRAAGDRTAGLAKLAQAEGKQRPRAYLDWFTALEAEGQLQTVLTEAQAALKTLPAKLPTLAPAASAGVRAAIADHLCVAAEQLADGEALRKGRWEAFAARPALARLLDLWDATPEGTARTRVMRRAAQHLTAYLTHPPRSDLAFQPWVEDQLETPARVDKSVLSHAHVLASDLLSAHELGSKQRVLGWSASDNPQGLMVPLFLVLLSGKPLNALPPNLKSLWRDALATRTGGGEGVSAGADFEWEVDDWAEAGRTEPALQKRLERLYAEHLPRLALSPAQQTDFLNWCMEMTLQRVKAIVGDLHRQSYGKAARLTAACGEVLRLRGEAEAARIFVDELRERFPRHRAFQAELDTAMGSKRRRR